MRGRTGLALRRIWATHPTGEAAGKAARFLTKFLEHHAYDFMGRHPKLLGLTESEASRCAARAKVYENVFFNY